MDPSVSFTSIESLMHTTYNHAQTGQETRHRRRYPASNGWWFAHAQASAQHLVIIIMLSLEWSTQRARPLYLILAETEIYVQKYVSFLLSHALLYMSINLLLFLIDLSARRSFLSCDNSEKRQFRFFQLQMVTPLLSYMHTFAYLTTSPSSTYTYYTLSTYLTAQARSK